MRPSQLAVALELNLSLSSQRLNTSFRGENSRRETTSETVASRIGGVIAFISQIGSEIEEWYSTSNTQFTIQKARSSDNVMSLASCVKRSHAALLIRTRTSGGPY